ncbi:hypothetical protein ACN47E_008345 [Coniothyrium glycines]
MGLTFLPRAPPPRAKKRSRAAADVDGDHSCVQKKKRRLRRFLITSRLSPQFSYPATNIVDRGSSKIAVWAKQKAPGRNLLRKAAILNRIRRTTDQPKPIYTKQEIASVDQEKEEEQFELARLEFQHGAVDTYTRPVLSRTPSVPPSAAVRTGGHFVVSGSPSSSPTNSRSPSPTPPSPPLKSSSEPFPDYRSPNEAYAYSPPRAQLSRRDYAPLPPSPLGLSNYDALDVDEDHVSDPYSHLDDDDEAIINPYIDYEQDNNASFSPPAITNASSITAQTGSNQALKTPSPMVSSIFSHLLDHDEPVFGDHDQVDDGAEAVWPSTFAKQAASNRLQEGDSTAPDPPAIFARSLVPSKRADSFATTSRPPPISPNFVASATEAPSSPNMISAPHSPNFAPSDAPIISNVKHRGAPKSRTEQNLEEERKRETGRTCTRFEI